MSVDTKQALRLVSCLANPSRLAAARWGANKLRGYCFVPRESEPPGGGEVGCEQTALIVENN